MSLYFSFLEVKLLSRVWLLATPWTGAYKVLHPWNFPGKSTGVGCHLKSKLYLSLAFAYIFTFFLLLYNWYFPKALTLPQLSIIYCIQVSDILRLNSWSRNGSQRTASHPINFKLNSYFNSYSRHRVRLLSCVQLFVSPWTVQSTEFSRPEYWSG